MPTPPMPTSRIGPRFACSVSRFSAANAVSPEHMYAPASEAGSEP